MTAPSQAFVFMEGPGAAATARHCGRLVLKSVIAEAPTLMFVRQGQKQITRGGLRISLQAGEGVMVPSAKAFDLVSTPVDGEFVATMLIPPRRLIDEIAAEHADAPTIRTACPVGAVEPEFLASFDRAVLAASTPGLLPPKVVENRAREVLIWLAHNGLLFSNAAKRDVAQKVRAIIAQDHARDWKALEVARTIAMSEATLRRRLEKQGCSFQQILSDVRMTRALAMLQVTDLSIGQVALEVGYESPSRFAARFKQRFQITPSAVRGPMRAHDCGA